MLILVFINLLFRYVYVLQMPWISSLLLTTLSVLIVGVARQGLIFPTLGGLMNILMP